MFLLPTASQILNKIFPLPNDFSPLNAFVTQAVILPHLCCILQILPASPYCKTPIRILSVDCGDQALTHLRQEKGVREECREVWGKPGNKGTQKWQAVSLSLPDILVDLYPQKSEFSMCKRGWNRQAKGCRPLRNRNFYGYTHKTWCGFVHLPCSSPFKGFPSQLAQRSSTSLWVWHRTSTCSQEQVRWKVLTSEASQFYLASYRISAFSPPTFHTDGIWVFSLLL